ncbi:Ldh family oxidoreductase, partial [Mesorhizobium sp.]
MQLTLDQATGLCRMAALGAGANEEAAQSLTASIIAAEAEGLSTVGLSHFIDYLEALEAGRIDGNADPVITRPALAVYFSDARGGLAHTGFDRTIDDLVKAAKLFGVSIFSQKNAYTCGALGYFTGRLAEQGLVSFAATNGPAVLAGSGSVKPVYCTNPMSFASPAADGPPLVIDQSSSATAFVNIRKAAEDGKKIPEGWALDASGNPTTDPAAAMKGAMLAFGGQRGAN